MSKPQPFCLGRRDFLAASAGGAMVSVALPAGAAFADGAAAINPVNTRWWLITFPSLALASTLFALNFLGDGLRDALDPKDR